MGWVERTHPDYDIWASDEERMRATFHARVRDLSPFLVPHRFEKTEAVRKSPENLDRAGLGYGISLNESYLSEIFGHVRGASAQYDWATLGAGEDGAIEGRPAGGTTARRLWQDATRTNTNWRNFFLREVLEWKLTSPGSVIVPDVPPGRQQTASDDALRRPYVKNVPLSHVLDLSWTPTGIRWIKLLETLDTRDPKGEGNEMRRNVVLYRLAEGRTIVERFDFDGDRIGEPIDMGRIVDGEGEPVLPPVLNTFGTHPDVKFVGSGLLTGLDDIVIDLFNTTNEMRAGYRDLVVAFLAYAGSDADEVKEALEAGTRFVDLGDDTEARLERIAADSAEVDAGVTQIEMALKAWARSAKRKAADFAETSQARSGASLEAEFTLDIAPLLKEIVEELDDTETAVMHRLAQLDDDAVGASELESIGVQRSREFDPEDEETRIARIVGEFRDAFGDLGQSPEAKKRMMVRWVEASGELDMETEVSVGEEGETVTLREAIEREFEEAVQQARSRRRNDAVGANLGGPLQLQ